MPTEDYKEPCANCGGAGFTTNDEGDLVRCQVCNPTVIVPKQAPLIERKRPSAPPLTVKARRVRVEFDRTRIVNTVELNVCFLPYTSEEAQHA